MWATLGFQAKDPVQFARPATSAQTRPPRPFVAQDISLLKDQLTASNVQQGRNVRTMVQRAQASLRAKQVSSLSQALTNAR